MGQRIADALAEEIVCGRYEPGQPLREQDLAARFEASRGPVREAFRILENERLVEVLPWRGARVARLSVAEMRNVFELRGALFALVARLSAVNGRDNEIEAIETLVEEMAARVERGFDPEGQGMLIGERMMEICGNDRAAEMLRQLERQTRWRYAALDLMDDRHRRQILSTWRGMADALAARDPDTAESIAKRMIRQYQEIVLSALECDDLSGGVAAAQPSPSSSRNPDRQRV
jgi:DNA-binding GntR family transcriptional regulator